MDSPRNDIDLGVALRGLRPTPRPEFSADLDARAAAGFPRHERGDGSRIGGLVQRLRLVPPRRLIATAGACTVGAIAVATAVVATSENGHEAPAPNTGRLSTGTILETPRGKPVPAPGPARGNGTALSAPVQPSSESSAAAKSIPSPGDASAVQFESVPQSRSGPYASEARHRDIERSAELVLGAEASEVRAAANKVFGIVHANDGIVLNSSIRDGGEGQAAATFELLIPSGKLGDALASISEIAEVRSRHESTADITGPTIGLQERLQDAQAKIKGLLGQLAEATTEAERVATEAKLHAERGHVAVLRSRLTALQRRASFSRVSLRIESGDTGAVGEGGNGWGVDDALGDAGHILGIAAGVTLIGLAIAAPLALLGLLAWLARRLWLRRARARALG